MDASTIVKRLRAANGLTRVDLARLADVSPSTVGRIENGELDPTWSTLQKLLAATGMVISGTTVVSAGDASATSAARAVLERRLDADASEWAKRWSRVGWSRLRSPEDVLSVAVAAGNAAKFARRARQPLYVRVPGQQKWQDLPLALRDAGVPYAISGLVATAEDRASTSAAAPIVYVREPRAVVDELGLVPVPPLHGTMLVAPSTDEMEGAELDGGLQFVTRTQALLDAFASGGRQSEKAEAVAKGWQLAS